MAFKKPKHASLNGCISKAGANSESKLTFSESSFNFLQKRVVFCTLYPRGYTEPLPVARQAQRVNAKINEVKGEIPSIANLAINNLATKTALKAVEKKITSVSNFVKKANYSTKINEIEKNITDHHHDKYVTTPEFNKLTSKYFAAKLKQANFATKTDFDNKLTTFNKQITSNKTKNLEVEKKLEILITKDYNFF